MKILKIIIIVVIALVALVLLVALFVKKEYAVEREIVVSKPKKDVFDYIKLLKNQDNYSVWVMMDPNSKRETTGEDGTVGFTSKWDSQNENVGKGEQTIKNLIDGERIDLDLRFIKPFEGVATAYMTTEAVGEDQTKVKWGFNSSMPYPMNIMKLVINMEEMLGKDLQKGLENLKSELEK